MLDLKLPNTSEPQAERCQILLNHFRCLPLAGNIKKDFSSENEDS